MAATQRTILTVIQATPDVGEPFLYVEWCSDLIVDENGKDTDKILDLVEELLAPAED